MTVTLTLPDGTNHILPVQVSADTTASATVDAALSNARGIWIVRWSVLSATDGHWSDGTIAFSVGTGFAPATIGTDQETRSWGQILLRALWLLLLTAVISTALNGYRNRLILTLGAVAIMLIPLATNWGEWGDRSPRLQLLGGLLGALAVTVLIVCASRRLPVALIAAALVAIVLSGHASGANHPRAMISLAIVHGLLAIG